MNTIPLYSNILTSPSYGLLSRSGNLLQAAKIRPSLFSRLSNISFTKVGTFLGGAQKVLNIYNQVTPIIKQTKPLIANIKTTFKVAKAFKRFSNESSLEKAFDNLPDINNQSDDKTIDITDKNDDFKVNIIKEDKSIPNPFFNVL